MKKIVLVFLLLFCLTFVVHAEEISSDNSQDAENSEMDITDSYSDNLDEQLNEDTDESKWEVLSRNMKEKLLKSKFISFIDKVLNKLNIMVRILLGQDYSLSLTLLFVFILWIFVAVESGKTMASFNVVKTWQSYVIGFLVAIIFAQIQLLRLFVEFTGTLLAGLGAWYWYLIGAMILGAVLAIVHVLISSLFKKEDETEFKKKKLEAFVDAVNLKI